MAEKILVVDDDLESLKLVGLMLRRQGYDVVTAESGTKALAAVAAGIPDLIILDVMMPDMSGLEVSRKLRERDETARIPIIMFTAKILIEDKVKGFEAGADDYLTKPTHPAELTARVRHVLERNKVSSNVEPPTPQKLGKAIGILGVKGGVGTTTLAVNLGVSLLQSDINPIVTDIRPGQGSLGLMLGHNHKGVARILSQMDINTSIVEPEVVTHQSGLRAVVSSIDPRETRLEYSPDKLSAYVRAIRGMGDPVIFDLGYGLSKRTRHLLREMDQVLYVVEGNRLVLEMASYQLDDIGQVIDSEKVGVVIISRTASSLPWHQVETILNREVKASISPAPELAHQALENRMPMVLLQPHAVVSSQYAKLAAELEVT
jgi:pilus assembly protein CpaE